MEVVETQNARKPAHADAPRSIVLSYHPAAVNPWVVHCRNHQTSGKYDGSYHPRMPDALREYATRCVVAGLEPGMVSDIDHLDVDLREFARPDARPNVPTQEDGQCEDCGVILGPRAMMPVEDLSSRVEPGEPMPAGQCPECGGLVHLIEEEGEDAD